MKSKRFMTLAFTCGLLLTSCNGAVNDFSIYIYDEDDTFINKLRADIVSQTKEEYDLKVSYASRNQHKQNEQINSALEEGQKLLAINMVDRLAASALIEKCSVNDASVVFFNREPLEEDMAGKENAFYVGSDPSYEGKLQAQLAVDLFGSNPEDLNAKFDKNGDGKIQALILKGEIGHQDAEQRSKYCISTLTDEGYDVDLLGTYYCNWNRTTAYNTVKEKYDDFKDDVEVIFSNNDDMAYGAIDYFLEKDLFLRNVDVTEQPFQVIGVDGTDVGIKAIQNNFMYGTIFNDSKKQAGAIVDALHYLQGDITKDEIEYDVVRDNYIYIKGSSITKNDL